VKKRTSSWVSVLAQTTSPADRFYGVWGTSESDVFVVGDAGDGSGGIVLHYNGSWTRMTLPPSTPLLESVWGASATDVYAVGPSGTILHYDGMTWTAMTPPATTIDLKSVYGVGTDVFAVGTAATVWKVNN
jgi:photosystem II stability/assembly factor-like uncharacterized protein